MTLLATTSSILLHHKRLGSTSFQHPNGSLSFRLKEETLSQGKISHPVALRQAQEPAGFEMTIPALTDAARSKTYAYMAEYGSYNSTLFIFDR
jgi:hypothetical protein